MVHRRVARVCKKFTSERPLNKASLALKQRSRRIRLPLVGSTSGDLLPAREYVVGGSPLCQSDK